MSYEKKLYEDLQSKAKHEYDYTVDGWTDLLGRKAKLGDVIVNINAYMGLKIGGIYVVVDTFEDTDHYGRTSTKPILQDVKTGRKTKRWISNFIILDNREVKQ